MTSITIKISDEVAARLGELARSNDSSLEEYVRDELSDVALDPKAETRRLARQIVRENRELYRRLA